MRTTAEKIRAVVDTRFPRVGTDGRINAQHVAYESTLRKRAGLPYYISELDGPGRFVSHHAYSQEASFEQDPLEVALLESGMLLADLTAAGEETMNLAEAGAALSAAGRIPAHTTGAHLMASGTISLASATPSDPDERIPGLMSAHMLNEQPIRIDDFAHDQSRANELASTTETELNDIVDRMRLDRTASVISELDTIAREHTRRANAARSLIENIANRAEFLVTGHRNETKEAVDPRTVNGVAR